MRKRVIKHNCISTDSCRSKCINVCRVLAWWNYHLAPISAQTWSKELSGLCMWGWLTPPWANEPFSCDSKGRRTLAGRAAQLACCDLSPAALVQALASQRMPGGFKIAYSVWNIHHHGKGCSWCCGFLKGVSLSSRLSCRLSALQK